MSKNFKLGEAVPIEWFLTKEAKERKKKIEESTKKLSDAMRASLIVSPALLKSVINI